MGLNVVDRELYTQYRAQMTPLLEAHGGSFGIDLWVAELLHSPGTQPYNRLFTIVFPSLEQRQAFFANPEYQAVRQALLEPSISARTELRHLER
jgi:uncharacterized protein (DUF1330 family)